MIDYIGDISKQDAAVLATFAGVSTNILEFGCGASTQVIAAYTRGRVVSVDTEQKWINKTKENLKRFPEVRDGSVEFIDHHSFTHFGKSREPFDFIFVDGANHLRLSFALDAWKHLKIGGSMAFHDTRRAKDFGFVLVVLAKHHNEIDFVSVNMNHSNITAITKKEIEPYKNWNEVEGREPWQIGIG